MSSVRSMITTVLPAAAAVAVFGTLYGAAALPVLGLPLTIASSLLIFSGSLQFALVALAAAGGQAPALLLTAFTLNLRHLVMGAVLRPRIAGSRLRRAALAFFLLDESFGFAIAAGEDAARMLRVSGIALYVAWQAGTVVGILGSGLPEIAGMAGAIFPVLFIGLAALTCRTRNLALRATAAAALTAAFALAFPGLRAIAPVVACIAVALPGASE